MREVRWTATQEAQTEPARPQAAHPAPPAEQVLALQRSAGNAAVTRRLQRATVTDEDGVELREATTAELVETLPPRIRRLLARLPAHLQQAFGRLPDDAQRRLLTLPEEQQEAILRMPHALLAVLLSQVAAPALEDRPGVPALPAPPENGLVPVSSVRAHARSQPKLPEGLLDFLLGRGPAFRIDIASLMSIRTSLPPLQLLGPALLPPRLHQPSGNDPLLQAGRNFLEAGGAEAEVRWALRSCGGNAAWAKRVLGFLFEYIGTPLMEQAKLELERAHGDPRAAAVKLAAVKRMRNEQATRAKKSAQARYGEGKTHLEQEKEKEAAPLRKGEQKRTKSRRRPKAKRGQAKAPEKSPLELLDEKYAALGEKLEKERDRSEEEGAARNQAALLALTGRQDPEEVERLLAVTRGDVHLLTQLGPALDEAGDDAETLAAALVASNSPQKLVPRCKELLAAGHATPATVVIVAEFMFEVTAPEAHAWARSNGPHLAERDEEMRFIAANKKYAALAVSAVDELGVHGAMDLVPVLHLGTPLLWCIQNLSGQDRKAALILIRNRPQDATFLYHVLQRNPAGGAKHKTNGTLIEAVKSHGGAVYDPVHLHWVTTAAFTDAQFATMLDLVGHGRTVVAALHYMAQTEVPVPQGVTVHGWVDLNANGMVRYPMAFSKGGYDTDQACLKHYEEMQRPAGIGGVIPDIPVVRMQHYFADLVAGCDAAYEKYKSDKPKKNESSRYEGRASGQAFWRINIKNGPNGPQVYHVDSGYEHSYWRHHD